MTPVRFCFLVMLVISSFRSGASLSADGGFVSLFNGRNLDGWVQHGGVAKYTVENGEIVGTSVPDTGNSFLCTKKHYSDFILEVDFKIDDTLNSGIQIRSHVFDKPTDVVTTASSGKIKTRTMPAGRVHGYQVEIDTSYDRCWSGGIYDEGRRGWLNNLQGEQNKPAREAYRHEEWNRYRVEAIGDSIKTYVNGVPAADLVDDMTPSGFIALQVHGVGNDASKVGKQVRWRNIRIKQVSAPSTKAQDRPWIAYEGKRGPGVGKHIVLISGDEEYRSEEALPQLGKILAKHHGFRCTVLFAINPETGFIDPNYSHNIPGLEALDDADLMIIFTRFRDLPDQQMKHIHGYLQRGGPVIGLRTATHAFNIPEGKLYRRYGNGYRGDHDEWTDGFGRLVLGEKWISHHGKHRHQSTRGVIAHGAGGHPILRGVADGAVWGPTDVYGVRLPLPGDSQPLLLGQVINRAGEYDEEDPFFGMRPTDQELAGDGKNDPLMPVLWTKSYQLPHGETGQAVTTTMGSSTDLVDESLRKVLVNAVYWQVGLADQIPSEGTAVGIVGTFEPTAFEFRKGDYWPQRKMQISEHAW